MTGSRLSLLPEGGVSPSLSTDRQDPPVISPTGTDKAALSVSGSKDPLNGRDPDPEGPGYLQDPVALLPSVCDLALDLGGYLGSTQDFAFLPGSRKTSLDPLLDHGALELREYPDHLALTVCWCRYSADGDTRHRARS
jgi:hypothetical protein